jgi:methyl-accepting chemotaxis protein
MATERWGDERLDRLAEIVMDIASEARNARQDLAETRQIAESNARATQASNERLDNLEKIVESNARAIQASNERLDSLEKIVESNARVIQLIANAIGEAEEERREFRQSIRGLQYENRQILDILLNRQNREDNPDAS